MVSEQLEGAALAADILAHRERQGAAAFLTPAQTADILEVSTATLRRYAKQFKKHLGKHTKGKRRRYSQDDLIALSRARDLLREGTTVRRANALLSTISSDAGHLLPVAAAMSHVELLAAFSDAREVLRAVGERLADMEANQAANTETIQAMQARLNRLQSRSLVDRILNRDPAS